MTMFRICLLLLALTHGARAADVTYPPGSRLGLVPPAGLTVSKSFVGFEDADAQVAILMVALPPQAYADLDKLVGADALKKQGIALESRAPIALPTGRAFLVIGRQSADKQKIRKWILVASAPDLTAVITVQMPESAKEGAKERDKPRYSDAAIRGALASLTIRPVVPPGEQLSLLPFNVTELAGFQLGGIIPGRAVLLADVVPDPAQPAAPAPAPGAHFFVSVAQGGPTQPSERDAFARDAFAAVPNLKEVRITGAEPLRLASGQGYQIMADAKDAGSGAALTVVQWLRFGSGVYLQMIGIAPAESWKDAYPRFRSVRDGIEPK